jgi:hypothetical protein
MKQDAISRCLPLITVLLTGLVSGRSVFAQEMSLRAVYNAITSAASWRRCGWRKKRIFSPNMVSMSISSTRRPPPRFKRWWRETRRSGWSAIRGLTRN